MIKNIIRQLLKLAQRLFTQLSNNEIVRIVKAWAIQLFTEKKEQIARTPQRKTSKNHNLQQVSQLLRSCNKCKRSLTSVGTYVSMN